MGAGDARHRSAASVDGAPALAAPRPGDAALKAPVQLLVLRLNHDLPGGVDQPPCAVLEKWEKTTLAHWADAIGVYLQPSFSRRRQDDQRAG
jgi:hypothetical protein